jgi:hypothetical protein
MDRHSRWEIEGQEERGGIEECWEGCNQDKDMDLMQHHQLERMLEVPMSVEFN